MLMHTQHLVMFINPMEVQVCLPNKQVLHQVYPPAPKSDKPKQDGVKALSPILEGSGRPSASPSSRVEADVGALAGSVTLASSARGRTPGSADPREASGPSKPKPPEPRDPHTYHTAANQFQHEQRATTTQGSPIIGPPVLNNGGGGGSSGPGTPKLTSVASSLCPNSTEFVPLTQAKARRQAMPSSPLSSLSLLDPLRAKMPTSLHANSEEFIPSASAFMSPGGTQQASSGLHADVDDFVPGPGLYNEPDVWGGDAHDGFDVEDIRAITGYGVPRRLGGENGAVGAGHEDFHSNGQLGSAPQVVNGPFAFALAPPEPQAQLHPSTRVLSSRF